MFNWGWDLWILYTNAKNRVDTLTQQLKSSPNDIGLQQDLGDAYYDLGTAAQKNAPNEAKEDYSQKLSSCTQD